MEKEECEKDEDEYVFKVDGEPIFNTYTTEEEIVIGDMNNVLVVRRSCFIPKVATDDMSENQEIIQYPITSKGEKIFEL